VVGLPLTETQCCYWYTRSQNSDQRSAYITHLDSWRVLMVPRFMPGRYVSGCRADRTWPGSLITGLQTRHNHNHCKNEDMNIDVLRRQLNEQHIIITTTMTIHTTSMKRCWQQIIFY